MKPKTCTHSSCTNQVLCKGLCRYHYWLNNKAKHSVVKTGDNAKGRRPAIAKLSAKRKVQEAEYQKLRLDYLNEHQSCEIKHRDCTHFATEIHHTYSGKDRNTHFLDVSSWKATCRTRSEEHTSELQS